MNNFEELVSKKIGKTIKRERLKQNISQKELAAGICSQAMISSIEHGDYIPNTAIFLALYQKLCQLIRIFLKRNCLLIILHLQIQLLIYVVSTNTEN